MRDLGEAKGVEGVALKSLQVVELAQGVAGPVCGRLFAALGHNVTKVEPPSGDFLRSQGPCDEFGVSFTFQVLNADKSSVVADLLSEWGRESVVPLVESADVVVTDALPGTSGWGELGTRELRVRLPRSVIVSITPFGLDESWNRVRGDSLLAESYGGLATMIGEPDKPPLSLGGEQAAHAGGFTGFFGAMMALRKRDGDGDGDGVGDLVDIALCDVAAYMDWKSDVMNSVGGGVPARTGKSGAWRMMEAADGWVGVIFQPEQWDVLVRLVGDKRLNDPILLEELVRAERAEEWWSVVEEWAAKLPRRVIYERAQRLGLAFGYCADVADVCASRQYIERGFVRDGQTDRTGGAWVGALFRAKGLPWRSGRAPSLGEHQSLVKPPGRPRHRGTGMPSSYGDGERWHAGAPLAGVFVVDLGTITAGAATGRLLCDYGATVVKVESKEHPDPFRQWRLVGSGVEDGSQLRDSCVMFESNNAGKLSAEINLKSMAGRKEMYRLVERADLLLENFRAGVTERLGIDYATLHRVNPRLIYLSLSSHGQEGPEAVRRSYGSTIDLLSGLASLTGYDDGQPMWSSADVNYPDQLVSLCGAGAAVYCVQQHITGVHLDIAQCEVVSWTLADQIASYQATGVVSRPTGNRRCGATPHDVYRCSDERWVAIECWDNAERDALAELVGLEPGIQCERWWRTNRAEADEVVSRWAGRRDREDCIRQLRCAGVPCAPVLSASERAVEPHFVERRVFLKGPPRMKGFPLVMDGYRPSAPRRAPRLGEHTRGVLGAAAY